jgi:hypothetical protein
MELHSTPIYLALVLGKVKKVVRLIRLLQKFDLICLGQRFEIPLRKHRHVADFLFRLVRIEWMQEIEKHLPASNCRTMLCSSHSHLALLEPFPPPKLVP